MSAKILQKIVCPLKLTLFCGSILLLAGCPSKSNSPKDPEYEIPDGLLTVSTYEEALEVAKEEQKKIMVLFTRIEFTRNSKLMVSEIIRTSEFEQWAKENVIFLTYDHSRKEEISQEGEETAAKFILSSYPISYFVSSDGENLGFMNYRPGGPEAWTAAADEIMKKKTTKKGSSD